MSNNQYNNLSEEEFDKLSIEEKLADYDALRKYLNDDSQRKKKQLSNEFEEIGEQFLIEIDRKRKLKNSKQHKLIPYILKYGKNKFNQEELLSYSYEDVKNIYDELKKENKSLIVKFIQFIFNIE